MVDHGRWLPKAHRMAILTNSSGRDMSGVLAGRFNTVVATCAIVGDPRMVEDGGRPRNIVVASIAFGGSGDMSRWQAVSHYAVVTASASTNGFGMVKLNQDGPSGCDVAGLAVDGGSWVLRGLKSFCVRARAVMASGTLAWGTRKHTVDVA